MLGRSRNVAAFLAALFAAGTASAQNGSSFIDAASSLVKYTQATVAPFARCADLRRLAGADLTITATEEVAEKGTVPAHCRVAGVIAPEIQFEVLLPQRWNRRFYMSGNGGYAGESIDVPFRRASRLEALSHGFAAAGTNTGHDAEAEPLGTFAFRNLQKQIDYAYRAVHLTAVTAKRLVHAYYDRPASFSYWDGCSTGGRQGLMSAQRFPGDFDGIVAGAPVLDFPNTAIAYAWTALVLRETPIPHEKLKALSSAVL
ncbi:MAG: tannase/feruloyl esterase family alpha/beta hydrolase, partial [Rhodospirillaceae bacterium]|nr:tannase/feruloyl esterase family alpha/beta hydrolase [Rhodospirillaceae bacterium]